MNIAINIETILNNKELLVNFIKEVSNENKVYLLIDEQFYNTKKFLKFLKKFLNMYNFNFSDILIYNNDLKEKIIEIKNIGFIIDEKNNYNKKNKLEIITSNDLKMDEFKKNILDYFNSYQKEYRENYIKSNTKEKSLPSEEKRWISNYNTSQMIVNLPKMNIYDYIYYNNFSNLNSDALRYFGKTITFDELFKKANQFAYSLKKSNIKPGDIVTICMPNTPEAVIAFFAVNKIGAVACMLHPLSKDKDILHTLKSTNSEYMIISEITYNEVKNIIDETELKKVVIAPVSNSMKNFGSLPFCIKTLYLAKSFVNRVYGKIQYNKFKLGKISLSNKELKAIQDNITEIKYDGKFVNWNEEIKKGYNVNDVESVYNENSVAVLLKTGGTTGYPKLVCLSNENIISNTSQLRDTIPSYKKYDELLAISPIFHGFGLVDSILTALAVNMSVDLHPRYDKSIFVKAVLKNKPTLILGVPTLFKSMRENKHFKNKNLENLSVLICGGDILDPAERERQNEWKLQHNAPNPIFIGMGLTQATAAISFTGLKSMNLSSVGFPLPLNNVKIIDLTTKKELSYGEIGELCISGPTVMKEYYREETETNETLELDENGVTWLRTGDICYIDENGEICYVDRQANVIIVSGVNVYSNEIEPTILEIPEVKSCAVIGISHEYKTNVPKAYVVLKDNMVLDNILKDKILEYCDMKLDKYHKIYDVEQIDEIPLTSLNKIDYKKLKEISLDSKKHILTLKK